MPLLHVVLVVALLWYLNRSRKKSPPFRQSVFGRLMRAIGQALLHTIPVLGIFLSMRDGFKKGWTEQDEKIRADAVGGMSREEAMRILGVDPNASKQDIKDAYKRLMMRNHPDGGGTDYLAQKINQARDALLKR